MRRAVVAAAVLSQFAPLAAASSPIAFENGLRRTFAVQGQEQARFRLADRMAHYHVPGVSVAIIEGCAIVDARAFGTGAGGNVPIDTKTLFQAGSTSKTVTAVAALRLVEQGKLSLDGEVRPLIPNWTPKESPAAARSAVTLRRLLNHTAGVNEIGGQGYDRGAALPTLAQILNGSPPANTPPVRIETEPGTKWIYSSGGYYLVQALMTAATGQAFENLAQVLVFKPAKMGESTFAQPLDSSHLHAASNASGPDGTPMSGGWRVNPELAAGGLWTTPSDMARFLIALTHDVRGESKILLNGESVQEMLKPGLGNWGLGVELGTQHGPRRIGHTGHNTGFVSEYVIYPDSCQGAVVMTNGDEGGWLIAETLRAIGDAYHWPEPRPTSVRAAIPLTQIIAKRFVGTYQLRDFPTEKFTITQTTQGGLYWARMGRVGRDLIPEQADRLFSPDSRMTIRAAEHGGDRAMVLDVGFGGGTNVAVRID